MENRLSKLIVNLLTAAAFVAIVYFLVFKGKPLEEALQMILYVGLVVAGIGLLIFVHELGHFLAAKLCDTKVEVFSVGFGPPIPGCHFKYGETLYKLAVFPLGGYVKMPGENPGDVEDEEAAKDPRLLSNKGVGQRMLIFSAGVVMNIILGCILFMIVYIHGKEERSALLGPIEPGSPAARAGIVAGSRLTEVDGTTDPTYEDLFFASLLARPNKTEIHLRWITPAGEEREGIVIPRKLPSDPKPMIGIAYGHTLKLRKGKIMDEETETKRLLESKDFGLKGTPVAKAGFQPGDVIVGIRPVGQESFEPIKSEQQRVTAEYKHRKQPIEYEVQRGDGKAVVRVEPRLFRTLGLRMTMGPVVSITQPRYTPETAHQFQEGDVIVSVDGLPQFDPMQLPDLFMEAVEAKDKVSLQVRRQGKVETLVFDSAPLRGRGTWTEELPTSPGSVVSIPALGVAYRVDPVIAAVDEQAPATLKNLVGSTLVKVTRAEGSPRDIKIAEDEYQWPALFWQVQVEPDKAIKITVVKDGETRIDEVTPFDAAGWYAPDRGFRHGAFEPETQTVVAHGAVDALRLGSVETGRFIVRIYMNLRSFLTGDLSVKYLSGPFKMFEQTYAMAESGLVNLILFLGIISINLAVVNFLPIPVLDGGHVMFLIIEKIRGKPATERMMVVANIIGLSIIASLMLFVIILDFSKYAWVQKLFGL